MSLFGVDSFTYNNLAAKLYGKQIVVKNSPDLDGGLKLDPIENDWSDNTEEETQVDEMEDVSETNEELEDISEMEIDSSIENTDLTVVDSGIDEININPSQNTGDNSNETDPIEKDPQQTEIDVNALAKIKEIMEGRNGLGLIKNRIGEDLNKIILNPINTGGNNQEEETPTETTETDTSQSTTSTSKPNTSARRSGGGGGGGRGNYMKDIDKLWKKRLKKGNVKTETGPSQAEIDMEDNPVMTVLKYGIGSIVLLGGSYFAIKNEYPQKLYQKVRGK
jgi:hypothetical protein